MSEVEPSDKQRIGSSMMLPPRPGTCPCCAVAHPEEQPHNQQSLYWQYWFYGREGRWPTWADAMMHCSDEVKALWIAELRKRGIEV